MAPYPVPADLEITEWRTSGPEAADFVVPFEARLNDQELPIPTNHPLKIHDVSLGGDRLVLVTLTIAVTSLKVTSKTPAETKAEMTRQRGEDAHRRLSGLGLIPGSEQPAEVA